MGRIFSYKELAEGKLPTTASFSLVEEALVKAAKKASKDFALLVFGSAAYGSPTARSDFDFILAYPADQRPKAVKLVKMTQQSVADSVFVTTDPYLVSYEQLENGTHTIGSSFLDHLRTAAQIHPVLNSDRIVETVCCKKGIAMEFKEYVAGKHNWLIDRQITGWNSSVDRLLGLQKIHEMPVHVARKYLACGGSRVDKKDEVVAAIRRHTIHSSIEFDRILSTDQRYTRLVAGNLAWLNPESYEHQLNLLEKSGPRLLSWLENFF